jgi:hypothetical protein
VAHLDDRQEQLQADLEILARPEAEECTLSSSSCRPCNLLANIAEVATLFDLRALP